MCIDGSTTRPSTRKQRILYLDLDRIQCSFIGSLDDRVIYHRNGHPISLVDGEAARSGNMQVHITHTDSRPTCATTGTTTTSSCTSTCNLILDFAPQFLVHPIDRCTDKIWQEIRHERRGLRPLHEIVVLVVHAMFTGTIGTFNRNAVDRTIRYRPDVERFGFNGSMVAFSSLAAQILRQVNLR